MGSPTTLYSLPRAVASPMSREGPGLPHCHNRFVTECLIGPCTRQAPEPWGHAGPPTTPIWRGRPVSKHKVPQGQVVRSWATFFPSGSPASGLSGNQKTQ